MAIEREFADMLNEHLSVDLINNELEDRSAYYKKVPKDESWKGGTLPVPIKGATASNVQYDGYTDESDLAYNDYLRGKEEGYKTLTFSMPFKHRDIIEHNGRVNKDSFLKVLADNIEDGVNFLRNAITINLLNGGHYDLATAAGTNLGVVTVANPQRFQIGQKLEIDSATAYVRTVDINAKTITVYDARTGGAVVDMSGVASGDKIFLPGQNGKGFLSLKEIILPASLGGSDTLHTLTKASNPRLQTPSYNGSSITASNILDTIFDAFVDVKTRGGMGNATEVWMSWKHLGSCMKKLESQKGPFRTKEGSLKAGLFGFMEIEVFQVGTGQTVKLVGVPEQDHDFMAIIDWNVLKFSSNGGIRRVATPDGNNFYTKRATTGYTYIADLELFGQQTCNGPTALGAIHSISY